MRIKVLAIALLAAVAMLQSVSQAAMLMGGTEYFTNANAVNMLVSGDAAYLRGRVTYEVWNTDKYGVTLGAGEFAYFYQIKNLSGVGSQAIETFAIGSSFTTVDQGVISGSIIDGVAATPVVFADTVAANGGSLRPLAFDNTGSEVYWNFQSPPIKNNEHGDVMFFVATNGPSLANIGTLLFPTSASGMVPVPVPVPPAIFLALAGLPFLRALGRKK